MNISLYKATALAQLENFADEETGEIDYVGFSNAVEVRAERQRAYVALSKNTSVKIDMLDNAIKELTAKKKQAQGLEQQLKDVLKESMKESKITSIEAIDGTFSAKLYPDRDKSLELDNTYKFDLVHVKLTIDQQRELDTALLPYLVTPDGKDDAFVEGYELAAKHFTEPSKTIIKDMMANGMEIQGAHIVSKDRLTIK